MSNLDERNIEIDARKVVTYTCMLYPYKEEHKKSLDWDLVLKEPCEIKASFSTNTLSVEYPKRNILIRILSKNIPNIHQLKYKFCKIFSLVESVMNLPLMDGLINYTRERGVIFDLVKKDMYEDKKFENARKAFSVLHELVTISAQYSSKPTGSYKVHNSAVEKLIDGEFIAAYRDTVYYWISNTRDKSLKLVFIPTRDQVLVIDSASTGVEEILDKYIDSVENKLIARIKENWDWIELMIRYLFI